MNFRASNAKLHQSGIRLNDERSSSMSSNGAERRFRHWPGVIAIALLCTLAGCGDGDSGAAGNAATALASAPGSASAPVLHCASACH